MIGRFCKEVVVCNNRLMGGEIYLLIGILIIEKYFKKE
jgi:hypothetical protein